MLYTMLNSEGKVAVPFLFTVFFIMMYIKYHRDKDAIPEILYSNLINALGCFYCLYLNYLCTNVLSNMYC